MHIRCPHCQNAIEVAGDSNIADVVCPSCGSAFNLLPAETEAFSPTTRSIGHFQLLEQLGSGGFGTVWKAKDTKLDRLVAVKIPRHDQVDPASVEMFLREARAAAQLRHPHIVAVHEVGRDNSALYIVSDFIQGVTLADRLTAGPFSPREATELVAQIAEALDHAHASGVIHRDLKPQNIMLDAAGQPHIMDFGLAKREAGEITMTMEGKILGTPAYMSPEQARGEGHTVDRRTDIYSLGAILFQLLTGELPFRGNRAMLMHQVLHDEPPSPRQLNGRLPRDLETIVLKCLEKDPRRRYATAQEVAAELRRHLSGQPIQARPISKVEHAWRWSRRNPVIATLGSGVLALSVAVAIVSSLAYRRAASDANAKTKLVREKSKLAEDMARIAGEKTKLAADMTEIAGEKTKLASEKTTLAESNANLAQNERLARHATERQLRIATAEQLAARALLVVPERPGLAALLAAAAVEATAIHGEPVRPTATQVLQDTLPRIGGRSIPQEVQIQCMALTPDGRWLATGSEDKSARVWDLRATDPAAEVKVLRGHESEIRCLALSPNGRWLVTGSYDKTARLWDLRAVDPAAEAKVLRGHEDRIECLALSADGRWLVTGSSDKTARVWDLQVADPSAAPKVLRGHEGFISRLALSSDARWLVTSSEVLFGRERDTVRVWDLQAADPSASAKVLRGHSDQIVCLAITPNGRWLATGSLDNTARVWDLQAADLSAGAKVLRGHAGWIYCLALTPDGRWLVTGSEDKTARVWDLQPNDPSVKVLRGHGDGISCVSLSRNGHRLVTGSSDKTARVWNLQADNPSTGVKVLRGHENAIWKLALTPDGNKLVTTSRALEPARVWDLRVSSGTHDRDPATGAKGLWGYAFGIRTMALSPNGRWLVTPSDFLGAYVYDLHSANPADGLKELEILGPSGDRIGCLAISSDGRWVVTATLKEMNAFVWDLQTAGPGNPTEWWSGPARVGLRLALSPDAAGTKLLVGHKGAISSLALTPDGKRLVTGSKDTTVRIWDLQAADPSAGVKVLSGHQGAITCLALSLDGRWLVTGSDDKTARIWDLSAADPAASAKIIQHEHEITYVELSADGERMVTAERWDRLARVWDLHAADPAAGVKIFRGNKEGYSFCVALSLDGRWLAMASDDSSALGSDDTTVRVWDLHAGEPEAAVQVLRGQDGEIHCLEFSPDGRWLIAGNESETARVWLLDPLDLCDMARANVGRYLTADERRLYGVPEDQASAVLPTVRPSLPPFLVNLPRVSPAQGAKPSAEQTPP